MEFNQKRLNGESIHEVFENQVKASPHNIAVTYEQESITYLELNEKANQIAHFLGKRGVGPEVLVGLYIERSIDMIVTILGVLKAGGAYLPIDPMNPEERSENIIKDAQISILIEKGKQSLNNLDKSISLINLDENKRLINLESKIDYINKVKKENLAYVIYTSGSTGTPKGVMVQHSNIISLFNKTYDTFSFDENDVWTAFHSYAFDFSVWEFWGALFFGGELIVVPYWISRSPEAFYRLLVDKKVTVLNNTPSAFYQLIHVDSLQKSIEKSPLRYVIFGGEALNFGKLQKWYENHDEGSPQLINMYGITETTVFVTYFKLSEEIIKQHKNISIIGKPINGWECYILDETLCPMDPGEVGELYVGGVGVSRGYLNRPELNNEKFIPHPFKTNPESLLYKTGDLVRYLPDGNMEYISRIDDQVQLSGFRVEIGEIESVFNEHPMIQDVVIVTYDNRLGVKSLAAYVIRHNEKLDKTCLRKYLTEKLPHYMVPSSIEWLESFPLTQNGKLDKIALPDPNVNDFHEHTAPQTNTQRILAEIWGDALDLDDISIKDNFYELGGHSLIAMKIFSDINQRFQMELPLRIVLQISTIQDLATIIDSNVNTKEAQSSIKKVKRKAFL